MAYQGNMRQGTNTQSTGGFVKKPTHVAAPAAGQVKSEALFSTGLFAPDNANSKAAGTIKIKEDLLIPAGSYINLYTVDERKGDKSPVYRLQVRAGKTTVQS